jgi:hypothetical protein
MLHIFILLMRDDFLANLRELSTLDWFMDRSGSQRVSAIAKKASQERERFWKDRIQRQPAIGLSITRLCEQAGVSANSFFVRKRRPAGRVEHRNAQHESWLSPRCWRDH